MTELPEKKALKMALTSMKANAITAIDKYNTRVQSINILVAIVIKGIQDVPRPSQTDKDRVSAVLMLLGTIGQQIQELENDSLETINDWKTYTEVLENYSAELDGTLTKIFEDALKQSEEQIEKQKELVGKKPEYTV